MSSESVKKPPSSPRQPPSVMSVLFTGVIGVFSRGYRKFMAWIDSRLPLPRFLSEHVLSFPTPMNLNYMWTFGFILSFLLFAQILTGIVLAMHYTPEITMAFASVEHITRDVQYGWLLRSLHANGASMFFVAVYIHMLRGLYYGSYKPPRDLLWMLGVAIYVVMIAAAFTGYVLPWGQMSYWAATVITNLFEAIPLIGIPFKEWLIGGFTIGNPTLNRFFVLHYLLPFVILGLVGLHIWALHVVGNNNPVGIASRKGVDTVPFHPFYTIKDAFAMVVFCLMFFTFVFFMPDALGHPDNYIPADPLHTPAHIVPEWYFLPFYAILRAVPDKLLGVLALFSALGLLFLLPWLDRSPVRSTRFRPMYQPFFWLFVLDCLALGYLGAQEPQGWYLLASRVATFWYFFHLCVVLPFFPMIERTKPLPKGIGMKMS